MSAEVDRILDILDVGLQTSAEHGYGTDRDAGQCARCQCHEPMPDGDLCAGCRAFLLGDSDDDPTIPVWVVPTERPPNLWSACLDRAMRDAPPNGGSLGIEPAAHLVAEHLNETMRRGYDDLASDLRRFVRSHAGP